MSPHIHAPAYVVCGSCNSALAGVTPSRAVIWHRRDLSSAQAYFADAAAILCSDRVDYDALPASCIAKMGLDSCVCHQARPLLPRSIVRPAVRRVAPPPLRVPLSPPTTPNPGRLGRGER